MKKIFLFITLLLVITGCSLTSTLDTPTAKVEEYLNKYQKLDKDVLLDLDKMIGDTDYTVDQKTKYKEIMKNHYKDLDYNIKKEIIDGDKATVETEVTVKDYSDIITMSIDDEKYKDENGNYSPSIFYNYQLDLFEKNTNTVTYNITFNLVKEKDEWKIIELDENSIKKIHGIYVD